MYHYSGVCITWERETYHSEEKYLTTGYYFLRQISPIFCDPFIDYVLKIQKLLNPNLHLFGIAYIQNWHAKLIKAHSIGRENLIETQNHHLMGPILTYISQGLWYIWIYYSNE